jgi:hypothetical protein
MREGGFCATLVRAARKSLILKRRDAGAVDQARWKLTPAARADAHEILPTHFPINNFHYTDVPRRVLVNDDVDRGFRGVSDTVLTQCGRELTAAHIDA